MKKLLLITTLLAILFTGCFDTDARVASQNLSKQADRFEIDRRVVFYNGWTGEYILEVRGKCSLESNANKVAVTCMTGPEKFKKHYLGLASNVTYFAEQMEGSNVSRYHYEVTFKPSTIVPDINFQGSSTQLLDAVTPDNNDK
jgi:hypothetical protein